MSEISTQLLQSSQLLDQAQHILKNLYPQLKDHKILREYIKILFHANTKLEAIATRRQFQSPIIKRVKHQVKILRELQEDLKTGPKDFMRTGTYIICAKDYKVHQLSFTTLEEFLHTTQQAYTLLKAPIH